jgi:hypothetical protein
MANDGGLGMTLQECKDLCDSNVDTYGYMCPAASNCFAIEVYTPYPSPSAGYTTAATDTSGYCATNCGDADDIDVFTCLEDDWDGTGLCLNLDVYFKSDYI